MKNINLIKKTFIAVAIQCLPLSGVVLACDNAEHVEHAVQNSNFSLSPQKVMIDILDDASIKKQGLKVELENMIKGFIPDNISRTSFNELAVKDSVEINDVVYQLKGFQEGQQEANLALREQFKTVMPNSYMLITQLRHGLRLVDYKVGKNNDILEICYSYKASLVHTGPETHFAFSVQGVIPRELKNGIYKLNKSIKDLESRQERLLTTPSFSLQCPDMGSALFDFNFPVKQEVLLALEEFKPLIKIQQNQYETSALPKLENIFKSTALVEKKKYVTYAWNVVQYKFLIEESAKKIQNRLIQIKETQTKEDQDKLLYDLLGVFKEFSMNTKSMYDLSIVEFYNWCTGQNQNSSHSKMFQDSLES